MGRGSAPKYTPMRSDKPKQRASGSLTTSRKAWTTLNNLKVTIFSLHDEKFTDELPEELKDKYSKFVGDDDVVTIQLSTGFKSFGVSLTNFTGEELAVFKEMFNHAIELAAPVVAARDAITQEAYDEFDDDSFDRLYREVPRVLVRKGDGGEHDSRLLDRLAGTGAMVQRGRAPREAGSIDGPVDHGDEGRDEAEDTEPQAG